MYRTLVALLGLAGTLATSKPLPIDTFTTLNSTHNAPLLENSASSNASSHLAASLLASWMPPLSTRGRYIIDAHGIRFPLRSGNWHGASGTYLGSGAYSDPHNHHAGEVAWQTPLCLDRASVNEIITAFLQLGLNSIRLPFSNEMLRETSIVPDSALRANPALWGLTPLQIFDVVVEQLTKAGFAVLFNNHTVKSKWCCGLDVNSRWNGAQTDAQWQRDWVFMVQRYARNPRVVGAELYNEVRRDLLQDPNWGQGGSVDWWQASMEAANRIQREASSDVLIIIDGINFVGIPSPFTTHYRPELAPAATLSHALSTPDKLVYSSHFYAYTGPNATGLSGPFGTSDPTYADLTSAELNATFERLAGFVTTQGLHYTAPLWISEFGIGHNETKFNRRRWWTRFAALMRERDVEWAYWPVVGWHNATRPAKRDADDPEDEGEADAGWSLVSWDKDGNKHSINDANDTDWRRNAWNHLLHSTSEAKRGYVEPQDTWNMLSTDVGSAQQSATLARRVGWVPGARQASCPDGLRLLGLSHEAHPRGLCTDAKLGRHLWQPRLDQTHLVTDARYVHYDWASGYAKLECPLSSFAIGYAVQHDGQSVSLVCAARAKALPKLDNRTTQRTVFFDATDALPSDRATWKGNGATAGACADDELLVGYAIDQRRKGWPAALLCRTAATDDEQGSQTDALPTLERWIQRRWFACKASALRVWSALRNVIMLL